ncbi:MAG TPA: AAA family ATPase [Sphingobacteriaceae bacterium]
MHSNLFLNRMIVYTRKREVAYDEVFHHGVNIIAGDNSSGKSTITHFIFYILGGAFNDWVKEAKQCSEVVAEVQMNEATITIRREINISPETKKANAAEPIHIFWGPFDESQKAKYTDWERYGYVTSDTKKSFSNVFFDLLDIPMVKGDNNITFHQILRLLYVDQDSPTSSLFYYEPFDTTLTRETVSDLLLGAYNQILYDSKQRLNEVDGELDDLRKEIKVIRQFIPNDNDLLPPHIRTRIDNKEKEINSIESELIALTEQQKVVRYTQNTKLEFEKLNQASIGQRETVIKLEEQINSLKFEIDDSKYFIAALENKVKAIRNSILTREFLGEFPLDYCPECLSDLKKPDASGSCKLCKEAIDSSFGVTKAKKIEQELSFQIKESRNLIVVRERQLLNVSTKLESEKVALYQLQAKVNSALKDVKSVRDERIDSLFVDKGLIEGEILQLRTLLENAELYQSLIERRKLLEDEKATLLKQIDNMTSEQEIKKESVKRTIEKEGLYLLNNDLKRQDDFIEAKQFNIDFRNNLAFIADKDAKYSASSNFYLKTSARFAIFLASLQNNDMRYPRFILCDNMEDKGIEEGRAQNFQHIIINEAEKQPGSEYQMIYTTSFLPLDLSGTSYLVGEYYTKDSPSLKNIERETSFRLE